MIIKLTLPFPPPELNPNKRLHWTQKTKIKNAEKEMGYALALPHRGCFGSSNIHVYMWFHAETKRSFDLDNALASSKAVLDGLALGLGVNDRQFRPITIDYGVFDKTPRTEITLETP
jgi:crossover junction endodeoxyribonuclease RusA